MSTNARCVSSIEPLQWQVMDNCALNIMPHSCRCSGHLSLRCFLSAQREERIQRNNAILEQLGVHTAAQALAARRGRRPPQRLKRKAPVKAAVRKCARLSKEDQEGPKKEKLKILNTGMVLRLHDTARQLCTWSARTQHDVQIALQSAVSVSKNEWPAPLQNTMS